MEIRKAPKAAAMIVVAAAKRAIDGMRKAVVLTTGILSVSAMIYIKQWFDQATPANYMGYIWGFIVVFALWSYLVVNVFLENNERKEEEEGKKQKVKKTTKAVVSLVPRLGENLDEYLERCLEHPRSTPAECYFRCGARKKGLTAGHVVRHHMKCPNKNLPPMRLVA